ncbi:DUF2939 domain-containing protein [Limobrevibacterium gyesilva]|uniref:DUF2939 domain-containing protein n=1 Tax=Limobrevibacterium gyesilva TaxID=2991712 RepID=A0AA42CG86_9PROT|nr:DUF2939 domain-containing protein [Limobrevibacterium gyesilva]MCW3475786.1 DUF2939 domain-containing protein [Limobrevibacterium gyesilva]
MPGRKTLFTGLMAVGLAYASAPYVTMWRLYQALHEQDAATLSEIVDWDAVRQGLKNDIAEGIIGMPAQEMESSNSLPPFGSSFLNGIAGSLVDQEITPQRVVLVVHSMQTDEAVPASSEWAAIFDLGCIERAFFDSPTSFTLRVRTAGQEPDEPPLRVRLELRGPSWRHGLSWKLVRAWVPQDLMDRANLRT